MVFVLAKKSNIVAYISTNGRCYGFFCEPNKSIKLNKIKNKNKNGPLKFYDIVL